MAKHGIVALTRGFKFSEPNVYDMEGIKCFALAPWYADTALLHSWVESAKEKPGSWTYEGKSLSSIDDIKKAGQMRILTVHEVGQGLIKALEYDNVIAKKGFPFLETFVKLSCCIHFERNSEYSTLDTTELKLGGLIQIWGLVLLPE